MGVVLFLSDSCATGKDMVYLVIPWCVNYVHFGDVDVVFFYVTYYR